MDLKAAVYEAGVELGKSLGLWLLENLLLVLVYTWFIWMPIAGWLVIKWWLIPTFRSMFHAGMYTHWVPVEHLRGFLNAGWKSPAGMLAELAHNDCPASYAASVNDTIYQHQCGGGLAGHAPVFFLEWKFLFFRTTPVAFPEIATAAPVDLSPPVPLPDPAPLATPPDLSRVKVLAIDASSGAVPADAMTPEVAEATLVASDKPALAAKVLATAAELRQRHPNRTIYVVPEPQPLPEGVAS